MFASDSLSPTSAAMTETKTHDSMVMPAAPVLARPRFRLQRLRDLFMSTLFLPLALPMIIALWIAVRVTSSGPGFYSQVRVGRNGRPYRILKLRTMTHNCELKSGAQWSTRNDTRITPLGRVLRKLHLDELPQLWNVFRGEMSLVGPRPERPEFVGPLSTAVPGYDERHLVRPGVTGLAQIQQAADTDISSVRTKVVFDRYYAYNQSLWLDARIMLGTAIYLVGFSYATVRRLMRLPNPLADDGSRIVQVMGIPSCTESAASAAAGVTNGNAAEVVPCGKS
jgi:lipopolysaccharide/colanic/teichoic acid biosynthesis glycosyltransferase